MIDDHYLPASWGIRPTLFSFFGIDIPSYAFFMALGLLVGILLYWYEARRQKLEGEHTFYIAIAAIVGGAVGAKVVFWLFALPQIIATFPDPAFLFSGRSIVGGLIGGTLAVVLVKRWLDIKTRRGNLFAPAVAMGIAIGRVGCFLRGCCYGIPTSLPWGVDFGDGILRHPTQLYEAAFMLGLFFYLQYAKKKAPKPGELFTLLLNAYFVFRFFIEFLREHPALFGLTLFQWLSIAVLLYVNRGLIRKFLYPRQRRGEHGRRTSR